MKRAKIFKQMLAFVAVICIIVSNVFSVPTSVDVADYVGPDMSTESFFTDSDRGTITVKGMNSVKMSVLPKDTEYGTAVSAIDICEATGLEYEVDAVNMAFYIYDENRGTVILVHNATQFASGDELYDCLPYFFYTNGEPMIDVGFFCEMFNAEYIHDPYFNTFELTFKDSVSLPATVIVDGEVFPLSIEPFDNEIGLNTSAEDLANAFGIEYSYDEEAKLVTLVDEMAGRLELEIDLTHFSSEQGEFDCAPFLSLNNDGVPVVEIGIFCMLFGAEYEYDESAKCVTVYRESSKDDNSLYALDEDFATLSGDSTVYGRLTLANAPHKNDVVVDLYLMQVFVGTDYSYLYGYPSYGTSYKQMGNVYQIDSVTIPAGDKYADYSVDVSKYEKKHPYYYYYDSYRTDYAILYAIEEYDEYGIYGGYLTETHPLDYETYVYAPFWFGYSEEADMTVGKTIPKRLYGKMERSKENAAAQLDVTLMLVDSDNYSYGYYGNYYSPYSYIYDTLGTVSMGKGETSVDYEIEYRHHSDHKLFFRFDNTDTYGFIYEDGTTNFIGYFDSDASYTAAPEFDFSNSRRLDIDFEDNNYTVDCYYDDYYWVIDAYGKLSIGGEIPDMWDYPWHDYSDAVSSLEVGYGVTTIGDEYFYGFDNLTSVSLPKTLKRIDSYAFAYCDSLEKIVIPESVSYISSSAFKYCYNLEILGYAGSYAETYAENYGFKFTVIGSDDDYIVGDVNLDNLLDLNDAILVLQYSMFPSLYQIYYEGSVDFNNDGVVDLNDAILLLQHSMFPSLYPLNPEGGGGTGSGDDEEEDEYTGQVSIYVESELVDCESYGTPAILIDGEVLAPLRGVFESLGASVEWDNVTRTVSSEKGNIALELTVGDNVLYKNGTPIILDVPAQIVNDRTMVPVRPIAEAFGYYVEWDSTVGTLYIKSIKPMGVSVMLDGEFIDFDNQPPTIIEGRTMVPMSEIAMALGATVEWDSKTKTLTSEYRGDVITLTVGIEMLYKNYEPIYLDVAPLYVNSTVLVPVRAIAEAYGVNVEWDAATRTVILTSPDDAFGFDSSKGITIDLASLSLSGCEGEVADGVLKLKATTGDPYATLSGLSLDADKYPVIAVKFKVENLANENTYFQIYYSTEANSGLSERRSARIKYDACEKMGDYLVAYFPMSLSDEWVGTVTRVRLDPGNSTGTFTIAKVMFVEA